MKPSLNIWSFQKALIMLVAILGGSFLSCNQQKTDPVVQLIQDWYAFALVADRYTEGFRAPVAARGYAYTGIAAWEAGVGCRQLGSAISLASVFPEIALPTAEKATNYHLPSVLNACYNKMFELIFLATPRNIEVTRKQLFQRHQSEYEEVIGAERCAQSKAYGELVANAVYAWARTDSVGHHGHLHNFDSDYEPPHGDSLWEPCRDFPTPSLLPHWGNTRTFLIKTAEYHAAPPPTFSMEVGSQIHKQALEVYTLNSPLSEENIWISEFWSDDHPSLTFSSAGRWISIAHQVIDHENPGIGKTLETYLLSGIALSDALVACWHSKYLYNLLRPETYIRRAFNASWRPIIHTPPFPAYPSGHAISAAAAAEVLASLYGQSFAFTDKSHQGRKEFKGTPRAFKSFEEAAEESAWSRVTLGVHFRMDCEEGTRLGKEIGKVVAELPLK